MRYRPAAIGHRHPGLLDQRGTAGFDDDPGHRCTRRVAHHAADRWLAEGSDGDTDHEREDRQCSHRSLLTPSNEDAWTVSLGRDEAISLVRADDVRSAGPSKGSAMSRCAASTAD